MSSTLRCTRRTFLHLAGIVGLAIGCGFDGHAASATSPLPMKTIQALIPVVLGPAAPTGGLQASFDAGAGGWLVSWTDAAGRPCGAKAPLHGGVWGKAVPEALVADAAAPAGLLAAAGPAGGRVGVRTGRRVSGQRPTFPSAALVIVREASDGWIDVAFADEMLEGEVVAAAVVRHGDNVLVVYRRISDRGDIDCRALRLSFAEPMRMPVAWRCLPDYPMAPGVAGVLAGIHRDVLIAAGGANFPDRRPWEGGIKKYYDEIFVLTPGASAWRAAGRLPELLAYSAVVSVPAGVLALGGENAAGVQAGSLWLRWENNQVEVRPAPALPGPLSSPVAVVLDGFVYVAGGYQPGPPRACTPGFFRLDLARPEAGWESLPTWPGPARAQGVIAALDGAVYLFSGQELTEGPDGKPVSSYLNDAYRYRPKQGWERLPDMPWSALAAPSPAPVAVHPARVFVLGGVDGRQAGKLPRETLVPDDILYFDVAQHAWKLESSAWPAPVVTAPAVERAGEWIFVSGEIMAGRRTTSVLAWRPDAGQAEPAP